MIDFTLYPNLNGDLGNIKVQIPDSVTTFWPDGDALVENFVYKDGKLAGIVDTKALINNETSSTTFPYDFVKITLSDELENTLTIIKGERNKYLEVKYEDMSDNFILPEGYQRIEYLESIDRLPFIQVTDMFLSTDIGFEVKFTQNEINTDANYTWHVCSCGVRHGIYPRPKTYLPLFKYLVVNSVSPQPSSYLIWCHDTSLSIDDETYNKRNIKMDFVPGTHISSSNFYNDGNVTFDGKIIDKCGILDKSIETINFIAIFTFGNGNNVYTPYNFKGKIYHVKVTKGDKLVKNLIPALSPTGSPCLYDTVNNRAWYNSGSGDFIYPGSESQVVTSSIDDKFYAKMTEHGVQRLYKTPDDYSGTKDDYASEYGFKEIVEPPIPTDGHWSPQWTETDTQLICNWVEAEEMEIL